MYVRVGLSINLLKIPPLKWEFKNHAIDQVLRKRVRNNAIHQDKSFKKKEKKNKKNAIEHTIDQEKEQV